jgi:CPA2 family monovalent cation:H+ antiporter-2
LLEVRRIALPGAFVQIAVATGLGAAAATAWGWSWGAGIVFGLALSVASTVVLLRALESQGTLDSINGRIAVGWLIVEDVAMVLGLVLLTSLSGWFGGTPEVTGGGLAGRPVLWAVATALAQVFVFVGLMWVVGRRAFPWLLWQVARTGSRELFTLCVLAAALGIAYASARLFSVSFALGAFFAGVVLRESSLSHRAAAESLPLRDAFAVLFFVSVGMLFDPRLLVQEPIRVLIVVAIIVLGKASAAFLIVLSFRYPLNTALTVSAGLAQIGEFSFILAGVGVSLGILPIEGHNLIIAGSLISIALNPLVFRATGPLHRWIRSRSTLAQALERSTDPLAVLPATVNESEIRGHVVLVGFGRVGRRIGETLSQRDVRVVVVEQNREIVEGLRERGIPAVSGDASDRVVLEKTQVATAMLLVVATPDAFLARKILGIARALNPAVETVVRVHSDEEAELFRKEKVGNVFMGEHELGVAMSRAAIEIMTARVPATGG